MLDIEFIEYNKEILRKQMLNIFNGEKQIKNIDKEAVYYNSGELVEEKR